MTGSSSVLLPHSHVVFSKVWPSAEMRWALEMILEFLTDGELCRCLETCKRWHVTASVGAWAQGAWHDRCAAATRNFNASACVAAEATRRHCCGRGKFLALAYAPACQVGRRRLRLRRGVDEARRAWEAECEPLSEAVRSARRRLRVVFAGAVACAYSFLPRGEATLVLLWPVRFAWHASSISRLAHDPLADYSIDSTYSAGGENDDDDATWGEHVKRGLAVRAKSWRSSWPVAHALTSPDALELRRYAFLTSTVCVVVAFALLLAWWRCVWYALGAACSELGLASFDVADCELRLKNLADSSPARRIFVEARDVEATFLARLDERRYLLRLCRRPVLPANPYRGHDDRKVAVSLEHTPPAVATELSKLVAGQKSIPEKLVSVARRVATRLLRRWRAWKARRGPRRFFAVAAELNRPLIRLLAASSAFVLAALLVAVCARETPRRRGRAEIALHYAARASLILLDAFKQDIIPVCFLLAKLVLGLVTLLLQRAFLSSYCVLVVPCLALLLAFSHDGDDLRLNKPPSTGPAPWPPASAPYIL